MKSSSKAKKRKNGGNDLVKVKEEKFKLEKHIQGMTEENLDEVFGLQFVKSEFSLNNLRIDSLAYDTESNSFVIVEYKRGRSFSVIDQGFAYLSLMLNHKADFILEYNERFDNNLKRDDVDWSQSKVIFIANSFTIHQQNSINFKNLPIELWEVRKYENNLVSFNQIKASEESESLETITKDSAVKKVSQEVKKYSVEDHFNDGWDEMEELYYELEEQLLEIDSSLRVDPKKQFIGFKIDSSNVVSVITYKSKLVIQYLRTDVNDIDDPQKKLVYKKNSFKYFGQHISVFAVKSEKDIDYAVYLAKQVYENFVGEEE